MNDQAAAVNSNEAAAQMLNASQAGRTCDPADNAHDLSLLKPEQAQSWTEKGYFIVRGVVDPETCTEMTRKAIATFTRAEEGQSGLGGHHIGEDGSIAVEEAARVNSGEAADQRMSKLFNIHRKPIFRDFALHPEIRTIMRAILGPDAACFNSQYIFKNPGVWGQPWHQDSLYYQFDLMPQIGVWLATSRATVENGCLFVAPGSHNEPIHAVVPDARPGSNYGYLEVVDYDFSAAEPVLMEAGDVLIFHSFLMHMSNDNKSDERRSALVYHYANANTKHIGIQSKTIDFMRV
ncbi:phytanoyl-CoA dioxygenase family protein [Bradyrhizobium sp. INPA03-11B]|uniref:phytanoyl-CoA dioxygenase family protein n=1 Tax=Bradyrhizobium sp. INPA03-11B TaxID=418598 RepID=UPI00338E833D